MLVRSRSLTFIVPHERRWYGRFYVLGGECHYLLQCNANSKLVAIPEREWLGQTCHGWSQDEVPDLKTILESLTFGCLAVHLSCNSS